MSNPIANLDVETLNREYRDAGIARFLSTKQLLLEYMEADGGRVWSAIRKAEWELLLG